MEWPIIIMVTAFVVLLMMNVPIAISIGLASLLMFATAGTHAPLMTIGSNMYDGINTFSLLAIPFFILSGMLMGQGGIATRLIDFAGTLVGRFTGGLAYVNVLTCMLFGSISGSAVAAVSSVGGFMIPEMNRKEYDRDFNVAVTTTAATTGLMIPPSNVMIVYSLAAGSVSIAALFIAGILPGIVFGLFLMIVCGIISKKRGYGARASADVGETITLRAKIVAFSLTIFRSMPAVSMWLFFRAVCAFFSLFLAVLVVSFFSEDTFLSESPSLMWALSRVSRLNVVFKLLLIGVCAFLVRKAWFWPSKIMDLPDVLVAFDRAFLSLLLVVIVLGGILRGVFTPTEAAAIAVVYSLILSVLVYREVKIEQLPNILLESGITTSIVMLLIGASTSMSWILETEQIPGAVSQALLAVSDNKFVILLLINILLLVVGTFMDMTPAVLIFTPIFLPVVENLGMNPVHFGIVIIANLCIGLCTPPVGTCLFVGCSVGKTTIAQVTRPLIPFFIAMVAALMLITYVPKISLWLPELTGLITAAQ